jgi:hypothetical protein
MYRDEKKTMHGEYVRSLKEVGVPYLVIDRFNFPLSDDINSSEEVM